MLLLNEKGEMTKGLEILVRQLLKMLGVEGTLVVEQINAIHGALAEHVQNQRTLITQNNDILQLLKGKQDERSNEPDAGSGTNGTS